MVWGRLKIILLHVLSSSLTTIYWKNYSFPTEIPWNLHWKPIDHNLCVSGLSILFHWSVCLFLCQYHQNLDYWSFIVNFELGSVNLPTLFFIFKIILVILGPLQIHLHFRIIIFHTKSNWNFDSDCIENIDYLGEYWHLNNIQSSNP